MLLSGLFLLIRLIRVPKGASPRPRWYNPSSMSTEIKPLVKKEETFDLLEIRLGRVLSVVRADGAPKPSYVIRADFGKFGIRISVGRLTQHSAEELSGRQILGVLNFEPREIAGVISEFLCLGVQYPKGYSGEATPITPMVEAKIGSKLF